MKHFEVIGTKVKFNFHFPTSLDEIDAEYLKAVTANVQVADHHTLIGIVYHEPLFNIIVARKRKEKGLTSAVVPIFIRAGKTDDDFILLDVGNHDDFGVLFQNSKMNYINKKDNALGIIINSDACDEESIYDDVEFVKGIVRDHDISFPVYLNIDSIITNDDLNIEMKTKIIKDFLEKCSANNIYVGLCGNDTNLCRVRKYCDITSYDAYLIQELFNFLY